jgi:hypothetical protein
MSEADFETVRWWLVPVQRDTQWTLAVVDPTLATITHFNPTGGGWRPWVHHGLGYHASTVAVTDAELLELGSWYTRMQTVAAPARAMATATGASHLPPPPAQPTWTVHRLADGLPQPFQAHDSGGYVAGLIECIMDGRAWDFQDGDGAALRARANAMEADAAETAAAAGTVPAQDAWAAPVATSSATSSSAPAPPRMTRGQLNRVAAGGAMASFRYGITAAAVGDADGRSSWLYVTLAHAALGATGENVATLSARMGAAYFARLVAAIRTELQSRGMLSIAALRCSAADGYIEAAHQLVIFHQWPMSDIIATAEEWAAQTRNRNLDHKDHPGVVNWQPPLGEAEALAVEEAAAEAAAVAAAMGSGSDD